MPLPTLTPRTVVLGVVAAVWAGATIGLTQHALSAPAAPDVPRAAAPAAPQRAAAAPVQRRHATGGGPGAAAPTRVTLLRPVASPASVQASASPAAGPADAAPATPAPPASAPASPEPPASASPSPEPSPSTEATPAPSPAGGKGHRLR